LGGGGDSVLLELVYIAGLAAVVQEGAWWGLKLGRNWDRGHLGWFKVALGKGQCERYYDIVQG
jgi:hypothetical protein